MKVKGKTRDGIKLSEIIRTILQLPNVEAKKGSRHELLLKHYGQPAYGIAGLCAVSTSTSYQRHIVPWVKRVTGYDSGRINSAFRNGYW